jgi:hypothetical protein
MRHANCAVYIGRDRRTGEIIVEIVEDGKSTFLLFDKLTPDEQRWVRAFAVDPLNLLRRWRP